MAKPINVFIYWSSSEDDRDVFEAIKMMLKPLVTSSKITIWDDSLIAPGSDWKEERIKNLWAADLMLLLLSPKFFESEFITETELKIIFEREKNSKCVVASILLKDCLWEDNQYITGKHLLPKKGERQQLLAIKLWKNESAALKAVAHKIRELIYSLILPEEAPLKSPEPILINKYLNNKLTGVCTAYPVQLENRYGFKTQAYLLCNRDGSAYLDQSVFKLYDDESKEFVLQGGNSYLYLLVDKDKQPFFPKASLAEKTKPQICDCVQHNLKLVVRCANSKVYKGTLEVEPGVTDNMYSINLDELVVSQAQGAMVWCEKDHLWGGVKWNNGSVLQLTRFSRESFKNFISGLKHKHYREMEMKLNNSEPFLSCLENSNQQTSINKSNNLHIKALKLLLLECVPEKFNATLAKLLVIVEREFVNSNFLEERKKELLNQVEFEAFDYYVKAEKYEKEKDFLLFTAWLLCLELIPEEFIPEKEMKSCKSLLSDSVSYLENEMEDTSKSLYIYRLAVMYKNLATKNSAWGEAETILQYQIDIGKELDWLPKWGDLGQQISNPTSDGPRFNLTDEDDRRQMKIKFRKLITNIDPPSEEQIRQERTNLAIFCHLAQNYARRNYLSCLLM